jgi:hypothetical protein
MNKDRYERYISTLLSGLDDLFCIVYDSLAIGVDVARFLFGQPKHEDEYVWPDRLYEREEPLEREEC